MRAAIKTATPDQIDAHSEELMQEFFQHFKEVSAANDQPQSIDTVFQGWAIQKIASLQLAVLQLAQATLSGDDEV